MMVELPPTPPIPPIGGLDTERLDELRDLDPGDTTYLDRAIGNFCANSVAAASLIRDQIVAGDVNAMRLEAHKLTGSALNLGASAAAAAARQIEFIGDAGTTEGALEMMLELEESLEQDRSLLLRYQATYQDEDHRAVSETATEA